MDLSLETTVRDVKRRIDDGEKLVFIDVREPEEYAIAKIQGSELVPMRSIPANLQSLDAKADDAALVIYCHHGIRSLQVANWLREQGLEDCQSMAGGIDAWSQEIDPSIPRY
jgi:rhodanese-related sulfurtransferase